MCRLLPFVTVLALFLPMRSGADIVFTISPPSIIPAGEKAIHEQKMTLDRTEYFPVPVGWRFTGVKSAVGIDKSLIFKLWFVKGQKYNTKQAGKGFVLMDETWSDGTRTVNPGAGTHFTSQSITGRFMICAVRIVYRPATATEVVERCKEIENMFTCAGCTDVTKPTVENGQIVMPTVDPRTCSLQQYVRTDDLGCELRQATLIFETPAK